MADDMPMDERVEGVAFNMGTARLESINNLMNEYSGALINTNTYGMYKCLEGIYNITDFKFKDEEREELDVLFKSINPYKIESYYLLKTFARKLFILLNKYKFLIPTGESNKPAIWRR